MQWQNVAGKFNKCNEMRHGSPFSPFLFSLYIGDVLQGIHNCDVQCKLFGVRVNVLGYADYIALLAPSCVALQKLINFALKEAIKIDMIFNSKKTKCMIDN